MEQNLATKVRFDDFSYWCSLAALEMEHHLNKRMDATELSSQFGLTIELAKQAIALKDASKRS